MTGMDDKEKLTEYRAAPSIFKSFLEDIFGEDHSISVDDGQGSKDAIIIVGDLNGIASYNAQLNENSADLLLTFGYMLSEDDDGDHRELDCEGYELGEEIDEWVEEYLEDFPGDSEHSVEDWDDNIDCNITLRFEPLFANAPEKLMVNVEEINNKINEIIGNHEK